MTDLKSNITKLIEVVDEVLYTKFDFDDSDLETFWREVLKRLGVNGNELDSIFQEVFGIVPCIGDAIYSKFTKNMDKVTYTIKQLLANGYDVCINPHQIEIINPDGESLLCEFDTSDMLQFINIEIEDVVQELIDKHNIESIEFTVDSCDNGVHYNVTLIKRYKIADCKVTHLAELKVTLSSSDLDELFNELAKIG